MGRGSKTQSSAAKVSSAAGNYDESKIKTLSSLEHIRLRSGMYIGRLGDGSNADDGIYVLLKEVIDNAVDEFIMGFGTHIDIEISGKQISVRDYGRGIPLGKIVECVSVINTGAKYNTDVFQFSVGLNGVGTKAVNALSENFTVKAMREGSFASADFSRGKILDEQRGKLKARPGTLVRFTPDSEIFSEYVFNLEFMEERLWNYAYLNSGLTLRLRVLDDSGKPVVTEGAKAGGWRLFHSQNGLRDLLEKEVGDELLYAVSYYRGQYLEFAFTHGQSYGETHWSFVNGQFTSDGGTHLSAFREGLLKGVNDFYQKIYSGVDVREGIVASVAVKLENPVFESQTKNKLGNTEIRSWLVQETREAVADFLHKNKTAAKRIQDKIINSEKLRKELNMVRKEAREAAKKIALKIPKLKDCRYHLGDKKGDDSTIFITEGASASGSMVSCRDVYSQAIFSLKGKPQNMFGRSQASIYKNEELYNMMMALGIANGIEGLRYARIVVATDADHDGYHIRNLLLTFFLSYFEELVVQERVYILETPLFRVRNKQETRYCYNIRERNEAMEAIRGPEVTRFKGLGEISPSEFGQFIGENIRLLKVNIKTIKGLHDTMNFYMGKNTPDRRAFIMKNLIEVSE